MIVIEHADILALHHSTAPAPVLAIVDGAAQVVPAADLLELPDATPLLARASYLRNWELGGPLNEPLLDVVCSHLNRDRDRAITEARDELGARQEGAR